MKRKTEAKIRAEEVQAMPHVKAWIERFQAVCADMPKELWCFTGEGNTILVLDPEGQRYYDPGGLPDADAEIAIFDGDFEGGAW